MTLQKQNNLCIKTRDGLCLEFAENGSIAAVNVDGQPVSAGAGGGLSVDMVSGLYGRDKPGPLVGKVRVTKEGIQLRGGLQEIRLEALVKTSGNCIDISGFIQNTTMTPRSVTLTFNLPVDGGGWTWGDDIRVSRQVEEGIYENLFEHDRGRKISKYPFASLSGPEAGISLGTDIGQPRVFRLGYDQGHKLFRLSYDFGLSSFVREFPSRGPFHFVIYRHDPKWGFRSAAEKYYRLFPESFTSKVKRHGNWTAANNAEQYTQHGITTAEDFALAFDELEGTQVAYNLAHGIYSQAYTELWMLYRWEYGKEDPWYGGIPQPAYDQELAELKEEAASEVRDVPEYYGMAQGGRFDLGRGTKTEMAKLLLGCGAYGPDGKIPRTYTDVYGSMWDWNLSPHLPKPNVADLAWNMGEHNAKRWAEAAGRPELAKKIGIYFDDWQFFMYGGLRDNFRAEHYQYTRTPLAFDPETKKPVLVEFFQRCEFGKWVRDRLHASGRVLMGHGHTYSYTFAVPYLDITGATEGSVYQSEEDFDYFRTLAYQKPISAFAGFTSRGDRGGDPLPKIHRCMLWGIFPGVAWIFRDEHDYVRSVKPLARKYFRVMREVAEAGWEPVTYANGDAAEVRIERFGTFDQGSLRFVAYNASDAARDFAVTLNAASLGIPSKGKNAVVAREEISDRKIKLETTEDGLLFRLSLDPRESKVMQVVLEKDLRRYFVRRAETTLQNLALYVEEWGKEYPPGAKMLAGIDKLLNDSRKLVRRYGSTLSPAVGKNLARKLAELDQVIGAGHPADIVADLRGLIREAGEDIQR